MTSVDDKKNHHRPRLYHLLEEKQVSKIAIEKKTSNIMTEKQRRIILISIFCIASVNAFQTTLLSPIARNACADDQAHVLIQMQSAAESAENRSNNLSSAAVQTTKPTTFREAEVLGLRFMQDGQYEEALKGKLIL